MQTYIEAQKTNVYFPILSQDVAGNSDVWYIKVYMTDPWKTENLLSFNQQLNTATCLIYYAVWQDVVIFFQLTWNAGYGSHLQKNHLAWGLLYRPPIISRYSPSQDQPCPRSFRKKFSEKLDKGWGREHRISMCIAFSYIRYRQREREPITVPIVTFIRECFLPIIRFIKFL